MTAGRLHRIRWAVRLVLALGVAASVAANVLHANDNPISQAIAAWPPLALLVTIELVSRVPVHRRGLAALRVGATATIAGIAAWVSYWHMTSVAGRYGEGVVSAHLLPISVDGLVLVASVSLVELAGRIRATSDPEAGPVPLPPVEPVPVLVTPDPLPAALPPMIAEVNSAPAVPTSDPVKSASRRPASAAKSVAAGRISAPKRTFEQTRRAAAALDADGMAAADIATTLGISLRQVRTALKPVPVDGGTGG